jgi:hypothetical protein
VLIPETDRRVRLLKLDANVALALSGSVTRGHVAALEGLPADVRVMSVSPDWYGNAFCLELYHPTFELVKLGVRPPDCGYDVYYEVGDEADTGRRVRYVTRIVVHNDPFANKIVQEEV